MNYRLLLLALLIGLGGCQSNNRSNMTDTNNYSQYSSQGEEIGTFTLDKGEINPDDLLEKFRKYVPNTLQQQGLENAYFSPDKGKNWGILTFKHRFIHWKLGIQFIQNREKETVVLAIIRAIGTMNGQNPNPQRLQEVLSQIAIGLQMAQLPSKAISPDLRL